MIATWAPHYLTWPWCTDEDTFATLALSWDSGIRPYRDIRAYNFPGHTYLHWLIGKTFGWGRPTIFYALDVTAVLALGAALITWSRRRLGGWLPGLVAYLAFLDFYLCQDYLQVAERDWHVTLCAALALMTLEGWPGRPAIWIAAALQAAAMTTRPHAALFLPAMASAITERPAQGRALAEWGIAVFLFTGLGFAPLLAQGLVDDLLRGLRVVAYGGPYSHASLAGAWRILIDEFRSGWTLALVLSLIVLWRFDIPTNRKLTRTWLLAFIAALLYRLAHPVQHGYLVHPVAVMGSIAVALPTAWFVSQSWLDRPLRLLIVLLIASEAAPHIPTFCSIPYSIRAVRSLALGVDPELPPPGCRIKWFRLHECPYEWADYCHALEYLRRTTGPTTEIANFLRNPPFPSFNGPVGRLSPFRAESGICWMWLIDIDLDIPFAESLEQTPDSVVVWSPQEARTLTRLRLERVTEVILRHYRPEARFGPIEIWRRSPGAGNEEALQSTGPLSANVDGTESLRTRFGSDEVRDPHAVRVECKESGPLVGAGKADQHWKDLREHEGDQPGPKASHRNAVLARHGQVLNGKLAGTHGNRTHQEPVSRPLTGFEDRAGHQPRTRSHFLHL